LIQSPLTSSRAILLFLLASLATAVLGARVAIPADAELREPLPLDAMASAVLVTGGAG
jgi:UDP-glucose 4-epimerase